MLTGAARGSAERILMLAHQTEAMARTKKLKPLSHFLRAAKPRSSNANAAVIDMLAKRGVTIRRVERKA